jgi:endogenous inhibitor of DNA gyrase (YacG/DUF329 family)
MIDSLVKTYKCPECGNEVNDNNVDVIGAAGTTINIDIECPECGKHSMIKSEVMSLDLTNSNITAEKLQQIKDTLGQINGNIKAEFVNGNTEESLKIETEKKAAKSIKDKEIVELNSELKQEELNVGDLL